MIASQTIAIRSLQLPPPILPSSPVSFAAIYDIVQLGEIDGPTNYKANLRLDVKWPTNSNNPTDPQDPAPAATTSWGSWIDAAGVQRGTTAFASATIPATGALPLSITFNITTLMRKLVVSNTGVYITPETAGIGAAAGFASKQAIDQTQAPKFHIVTSAGTYDVGALADSQVTTNSASAGMDTFMRDPYCIKPDLSTVQGVITSATLTLWDITGSQLRPCRYDCYYCEMPALVHDPVRQLGGVAQGIAVNGEATLAVHPSVVWYHGDFTDLASFNAGWTTAGSGATPQHTPTFPVWADYGLTAIRIPSPYPGDGTDGVSILTRRKDVSASNYSQLYTRYMMLIDRDAAQGLNPLNTGTKLPGMGNDVVDDTNGFSYRMSHTNVATSNPDAYGERVHAYDFDNPFATAAAQDRRTQFTFEANRVYTIEQYVQMNTKTGSTFNADGVLKIWVDGVLVYSDTARRIQGAGTGVNTGVNQIGDFFANFFHGGTSPTLAQYHYEFGGICMATQYIGPPKRPASSFPAWRPPAGFFADIPSTNVPADVFSATYPAGDWTALFIRWTGGAYIRDYSKLGAFCNYGAGHENSSLELNIQGSLTFDFSALKWEYHNATQGHAAGGNPPPNINAAGEFADGTPYASHTYLGLQELPTSWGGGPKGSVVDFVDLSGPASGGILHTTHKIDLSKDTLGYSKLTEGFGGGGYPISAMDEGRQGWWVCDSSTTLTMRFVSKTGAVGPVCAASIPYLAEPGFVLWPSKQALVQIPGGYWEGISTGAADTHRLYIYDIITNTEQIVQTTGKPPVLMADIAFGGVLEMATIAVAGGGTGYVINDTITFYTPDATLPQNSPKVVVTSVGAGGAVTEVAFFDFALTGYTLQQRGWLHNYLNWASGTIYAAGDKVFGSDSTLYTSIGNGNIGHDPTTTTGFWTNKVPQVSQTGGGSGAVFTATWQTALDMFRPWFSGLCWCEPLRCIVGFDAITQEIVTLTPPTGDIYGSAWTWARPTVSHWAAGDPSGQTTLNQGQNGPYSKFRYIDSLKAFVLFTCVNPAGNAYRSPQIITLPGL